MSDPTAEKILQAAKDAFYAQGYRVSMVDIAKRAGVAKQTLYNHFDNKEALFAVVMQGCKAEASAILQNQTLSIEEKILQFAYALRHVAMTPSGIAGYRAMTAEAHHFPAIAASFYQHGVGVLHQQLASVLGQAHQQGLLCCESPALAADMLFSMLTGFERSRLLLGVAEADDGESSRVAPIVHAFLKAFAPEPHSF
ncbi:MAG: TetR/AcrR family transcriptional regulator [Gammaproteobacteria bacterium]|nr:TetR/AcrR family transcriptional regulator [Gammaproteobacteria bacterium]